MHNYTHIIQTLSITVTDTIRYKLIALDLLTVNPVKYGIHHQKCTGTHHNTDIHGHLLELGTNV